ncbi:MAG: hypothetical protein ACTSVY_00360 [Candidatus Helarchaeota archaeon]
MTSYIVVQCNKCKEFSFIREQQKSFRCKKCNTKNDYTSVNKPMTAREANNYIVKIKSRNSTSGFLWVTR